MKLKDQVALVTGSGRNIGRAIALAFANEGADVVVNAREDRASVEGVSEEIRRMGRRALPIVADVGDEQQVRTMMAEVMDYFGRVDIAVNNAAIRPGNPFVDIPVEEWRRVLAVNLDAGFHISQAVLPGMIERKKGSLIFLAGPNAWGLSPGRCHVAASKAAIVGLAKCLAMELAASGVRSNVISPGMIESDRPPPPDAMLAKVPLGRLGTQADIANASVYLASDDSAYVTGQVLFVNGGDYWQ